MQRHASYTEAILRRVRIFDELAVVAAAHHERLDGKGYPKGLSGADITLETRIITPPIFLTPSPPSGPTAAPYASTKPWPSRLTRWARRLMPIVLRL